jgi:CRP/FNR family transcriptional regulator
MSKIAPGVATTPCRACPLRPLDVFRDRSPADVTFLQTFKAGELAVSSGSTIISENVNSIHLFTLLSGWAFRYKTLEDGRRQIVNYVLPGDFIGLQASLSDAMTHGVDTLTNAVFCVFPRERLWDLFVRHPQIAYDITWLAAREERTLDEHLLAIGRKTALERLAYLLWYLYDKARDVGLLKGNKLDLPMSQAHLADTLGLSLVHTNKTLQKLREKGSILLDERRLTIINEDALKIMGRVETVASNARPLI